MDGCISEDGMVAGTYLHGIFDNEMFAKAYFQLEEKEEEQSFEQFKNSQYDKLADLIRASIDMEEVYRILEI